MGAHYRCGFKDLKRDLAPTAPATGKRGDVGFVQAAVGGGP